jgi:hypothetical protein
VAVKNSEEIINEISEILTGADGEFIEEIANQVLAKNVTYIGDSLFEEDEDEDEDEYKSR